MPSTMGDGELWPKISIVTPSYNQGHFLEETIRSALLQGYPNLEYIIIDGGSTDNSLDIIRKYEQWITYWVSETDNGQSEAINKGWQRSTGRILAWINSDDTYEIDALIKVAEFILNNTDVDMIYGDCNIIDDKSRFKEKAPTKTFDIKSLVCNEWFIPQQSTFMSSDVIKNIGRVNENLHLVMDWDLWLRIALKGYKISYFPQTLANFRQYPEAKTFNQSTISAEEKITVLNDIFANPEYFPKIIPFKRSAYWYVYQWAGYVYFKKGNRKRALSYFFKSVMHKPICLTTRYTIERLFLYLLGSSRYVKCHNYFTHIGRKLLGRSA